MKKKPNPLDDPPSASSSEDGNSEEEEGSSSEEDEPQMQAPVKTPSAAAQQDESDSESGSEIETDSDSQTERPNPPISGSGKSTTVVSTKPKQKEAPKVLALPALKSVKRRESEETSRDTKKQKVTSGDDVKNTGEDTKKLPFTRVWLEEDEIVVLQGMLDFKSVTGKSPYEDMNGYYDFRKKSISFDVSKTQFMDKIRSLKKKYLKQGVEPSYTKPHDRKSFELSKTIWGPEGIALESAVKSKKSTTKKKRQELVFTSSPNGKNVEEENKNEGGGGESDWFDNSFIVPSISAFGIDEHFVKQRLRLVSEETKNRLVGKLKALQAKEIGFVLQKTEFFHEVTSLIFEASKNSRH